MVYLYSIGALAVLGPLILALPLLSQNRVYRTATHFAGINVGILTFSFFINVLRWGVGSAGREGFALYFTSSLPNFYLASLLVGSTLVPQYLSASTRFRLVLATLGSLFLVYFLTIGISNILQILSMTITYGLPTPETLSELIDHMLTVMSHPKLSTLVIFFTSTFIALNGTAAIMRRSDEAASSKDEQTE